MSGARINKSSAVEDDPHFDARRGVLTGDSCCARLCSPLCRQAIWVALALVFLGIGLFAALGEHVVATIAMKSQLVLTDWRTQLFRTWQNEANMDINVFRRYYFYNVTNPHDVYLHRVKPDVNMVGPFVFQTNRLRPLEYMAWDEENLLNFRYHDFQYFRPELSVDNTGRRLDFETEKITTINMALITAAYRVGKIPEFRVQLVNGSYVVKQDICLLLDLERLLVNREERALGPKGYFTQRTVKEWLFGFKDDTLEMLNAGSAIIDYYVPTVFHMQFNDSVPAPGPIDLRHGQKCPLADEHSWCNSSTVSDSAVMTGRAWDPKTKSSTDDLRDVGIVRKWAENDRFWWLGGGGTIDDKRSGNNRNKEEDDEEVDDADCQRVEGTEGLFVGAFTTKTSRPKIFVDGIYRAVELAFTEESEVDGIPTLRFGVAPREVNTNARNRRCYHQYYKGGILNLSNTAFAPGWVTAKFFYPMDADQDLLFPAFGAQNMHVLPNGTKTPLKVLNFTMRWPPNSENRVEMRDIASGPNYTDDELGSRLDVHALTGSTLTAHSLMQINAPLGPLLIDGCDLSFSDLLPQTRLTPNGTEYMSYFPETGLPVLLVDRIGRVPEPLVKFLKDKVILPFRVMRVLGWSVLGLSLLLVLVLLFYYGFFRPRVVRTRRGALGSTAAASPVAAIHSSYIDEDGVRRTHSSADIVGNGSLAQVARTPREAAT